MLRIRTQSGSDYLLSSVEEILVCLSGRYAGHIQTGATYYTIGLGRPFVCTDADRRTLIRTSPITDITWVED